MKILSLLVLVLSSTALARGGNSSGGDEGIVSLKRVELLVQDMSCIGETTKDANSEVASFWVYMTSFSDSAQFRVSDWRGPKMIVQPDTAVKGKLVYSKKNKNFELHYLGEQAKAIVSLKSETDEWGSYYSATISTFNNYPAIFTDQKFRCRP